MNKKNIYLIILLLCIGSSSCISQSLDANLKIFIEKSFENKSLLNKLKENKTVSSIFLKSQEYFFRIRIDSVRQNYSIRIEAITDSTQWQDKEYFEIIDYIIVENSGRLQLLNRSQNLLFSAFFRQEKDTWCIESSNIDKNK